MYEGGLTVNSPKWLSLIYLNTAYESYMFQVELYV